MEAGRGQRERQVPGRALYGAGETRVRAAAPWGAAGWAAALSGKARRAAEARLRPRRQGGDALSPSVLGGARARRRLLPFRGRALSHMLDGAADACAAAHGVGGRTEGGAVDGVVGP